MEESIKEHDVVEYLGDRATVIHIYKNKDVCIIERDDNTLTDVKIDRLKKYDIFNS